MIKNQHRITSTQKDTYYHKNEWQHKHGQYNNRVNEWQHKHGQYNSRVKWMLVVNWLLVLTKKIEYLG